MRIILISVINVVKINTEQLHDMREAIDRVI